MEEKKAGQNIKKLSCQFMYSAAVDESAVGVFDQKF